MRKLPILTLLLLTGCYSYGPAGSAPLSLGTPVRARLAAPSDFRLTNVSVNDAVIVNGEVIEQRADTLLLSALSLRSPSGFDYPAAGETLRIPTSSIQLLERRKVSLLRSGALVVLAGTLTSGLFSIFETGGESSGGKPSPNPE